MSAAVSASMTGDVEHSRSATSKPCLRQSEITKDTIGEGGKTKPKQTTLTQLNKNSQVTVDGRRESQANFVSLGSVPMHRNRRERKCGNMPAHIVSVDSSSLIQSTAVMNVAFQSD